VATLTGSGGHIAKGPVDGPANAAFNCVRTWGVTLAADLGEVICSATKQGRIRVPGNADWSGSFTAYGRMPPVMPRETFWFAGALEDGTPAAGVSGNCIVDSVVISWDQEAGTPIGYTVNFGGIGELMQGGAIVVPDDAAVPDPLSSKGCLLKIGTMVAVPVYTEVAEVRTMSLTLSADNQQIFTAGGSGWPGRAAGNIEVAVEATVYANDADGWASFPQPNGVNAVQMFIDGSDFWLLKWLRWGDLGGMDVDIEGSAMVGGALSGAFRGFENDGSDGDNRVVGTVTDPDDAEWWPLA